MISSRGSLGDLGCEPFQISWGGLGDNFGSLWSQAGILGQFWEGLRGHVESSVAFLGGLGVSLGGLGGSLGGLGRRVGHLVSHLGGCGVFFWTVVDASWAQK